MKKITIYTLLLAAGLMTACRSEEPQNMAKGDTVEISFPLMSDYSDMVSIDMDGELVRVPMRLPSDLPGDPGNAPEQSFIKPQHFYILTTTKSGVTTYTAATHVTGAAWKAATATTYEHPTTYHISLPSASMDDGKYYVYAIASPWELTFSQDITWTDVPSAANINIDMTHSSSITKETIDNLTFSIPTGTSKKNSEVLRNIFSTVGANAECSQTSFQPRRVLYHTASLLDINWSNEAGFSSTTLRLGDFASDKIYCFKPGAAAGAATYTEDVTLNPETQHYGRYATYVAKVPNLTATCGSVSKTAAVNPGPDANLNTWQRILWKVN